MGSYDLLIDYNQPPDTPLRDSEAAWMDSLLQEKELRLTTTQKIDTGEKAN